MSKKKIKNKQGMEIEDKEYWTKIINLWSIISNEVDYLNSEAISLQNELGKTSDDEDLSIIHRSIKRIIVLLSDSQKIIINTLNNINPEKRNSFSCYDCINISETLKIFSCIMEFSEIIAKFLINQEQSKIKTEKSEISLKASFRAWYFTCNLIRINLNYLRNEIQSLSNCDDIEKESVSNGSSTEERLLTQEDEELLSEEDATTNEALKSIKATGKSGIANYMSKTSQLNDFPRGERIYVKSQGIIPPHKTNMKYKDAIDKIRNGKYYFMKEKTIIVKSSQNDKIINKHKIEEYRKK